jgi:hypothetical protein
MLLCTCRKEKMATFYSLGPRTSIPCLRRNGQALRTVGSGRAHSQGDRRGADRGSDTGAQRMAH